MSAEQTSYPDIKSLLSPYLVDKIRWVPEFSAFTSILIGMLGLIGWIFNIPLFKSVLANFINMKVSTAIGLILSGIALFLFRISAPSTRRFLLGRVFGLVIFTLGALSLFQTLFGWNPNLDLLLFQFDKVQTVSSHGQMAPTTAACFILLGITFGTYGKLYRRLHPWSHFLAILIAFVAFFSLVEYLYGAHFILGWAPYTDMALQASVAFLVLSLGILTSRVNHDSVALLLSNGPGGIIARKLLPLAILIPLVLGGLRVAGEQTNLFTAQFGTALFTTVFIATIVASIWNQSLNLQRSELLKDQSNRENDSLRLQVELREQFVSMLTHDLRNPLTAARACAELLSRSPENPQLLKKLSTQITNSISRADQMIQNLLDINRVRAGHPLPIKAEFCDLRRLINETLEELNTVHGWEEIFARIVGQLIAGTI